MTDFQKTKSTLFLANILQEPFVALNLMLDVILATHFGATALQISLLTTLRPVLAVFAFYWGSILLFRPELLRFSLVGATGLATLLFFFAPFVDNIWYFIAAEAFFILFWRAANPAQIEILKLNVKKGEREALYSRALGISHASGMVIGPILGLVLKMNPDYWKILFCITSLLYIASSFVKQRFFVPSVQKTHISLNLKDLVIHPWRDSWRLLRENRKFFDFQLGFFIAGSGLMFAKPSLPSFFTERNLSLFEIFSLFTLLEGFGFVMTCKFWAKYLQRMGIHRTSSLIALFFALQPLFLVFSAKGGLTLVCLAYFFYGAAQAGSRLVWNLSGSMLCGRESSAQYSSVNILAIGVRGMFVPLLGGVFASLFGPEKALIVSFFCLLSGAFYLVRAAKGQKVMTQSV